MAHPGLGVILACGPSLTQEDADACRGATVYAVNDAYRLAPWADHLFASDYSWWEAKIDDVRETFTGRCWSISSAACQQWQLEEVRSLGYGCGLPQGGLYHPGHSGQMGISLAILHSHRSIVLLGFDCGTSGGRTHFHGGHSGKLRRAKVPYDKWISCADEFSRQARAAGIRIVNASRQTALTCYPRMTITDTLSDG